MEEFDYCGTYFDSHVGVYHHLVSCTNGSYGILVIELAKCKSPRESHNGPRTFINYKIPKDSSLYKKIYYQSQSLRLVE